jgi:hypothetical protein
MTTSTAGYIFRAAPGMHVTNNDKVISDESKRKEENIEQMTKDKHFREEQMGREEGANKVLESGCSDNKLTKPQVQAFVEQKQNKKVKITINKAELLGLWKVLKRKNMENPLPQ